MNNLKEDNEIYEALHKEIKRQSENIELIASENFVSKAVLEAMGSELTNKYAEGYPGKRYYGGCVNVDTIENIAIERAKKLFGAEHANVQPHSGSQANMAVYMSVLTPGDTVMGMDLSNGGHLTHGSKVNFSGKLFNFVSYGINSDGYIDYDDVEKKALEFKPKMIVAGASAYPRKIDFKKFREIADKVGAYLMVDMAHIAGLVCKEEYAKAIDKTIFPGIQGGPLEHVIAAKAVCFKEALEPSFTEYIDQVVLNCKILAEELVKRGFKLVSGGTDNHLMLIDLTSKNMTGKEAESLLEEVNITANKNAIPNDMQKPSITSGIRVGTAACTTKGLKQEDMVELAHAMELALSKYVVSTAEDYLKNKEEARAIVKRLTSKYVC